MSFILLYYALGILIVPGILLGIYAQAKVSRTYKTYSQIQSANGITASQLARTVLDSAGLQEIELRREKGYLTDHYHPKKKYIALSEDVYDSSSVASLGVAMHEVGHAIQKKEHYFFLGFRQILVPITNLASTLLWPMVIIGLLLGLFVSANYPIGLIFIGVGVCFYGLSLLLNLITLPVEFNASKRAVQILEDGGFLNEIELDGARQVLKAAALTYVASFVVALLEMLRFVLYIFLSREN